MKKFRENILIVVLVLVVILACVVMALTDTTTSTSTHTNETQAQATVSYVLKNQWYVSSAHQMLYTVRYDITVNDTTKTCVQTSYTVMPKAWQLEEGDVVECTLVTTYDSEGNVISEEIK